MKVVFIVNATGAKVEKVFESAYLCRLMMVKDVRESLVFTNRRRYIAGSLLRCET